MSRIGNFNRFTKGDYKEAPEWFDRFSRSLNEIIDSIVTVVNGEITTNNQNAEIIEVAAETGVPIPIVAPNVTGEIEEVRVVWGAIQLAGFGWERTTLGAIITPNFVGAPAGWYNIRVKVIGGD